MFIFRCVCAHERVGGCGGVMLKRPEVVFGYLLTSPYYLRQGQIFENLQLADSAGLCAWASPSDPTVSASQC